MDCYECFKIGFAHVLSFFMSDLSSKTQVLISEFISLTEFI